MKRTLFKPGSCWSYIIKGNFKERMSLIDVGLAVAL